MNHYAIHLTDFNQVVNCDSNNEETLGNLSINTIVLGEMQNITQILNMYVQYLGNALQYHKILGSQLIN